jgi:predicted ester cyclase
LTASIWLHDGPTEPNGGNADGTGGTFDSTGWTLYQLDQTFTIAPATNPFGVTDIIPLGDTQARFVALDITANQSTNGATAFTGISEMQFFATPTTPFAVTNITVEPADVLEFVSDAGQSYRLEFTTNPTNVIWQDAGFTIEGDGGTLLAFDPAGVDTQKTYRIIPF